MQLWPYKNIEPSPVTCLLILIELESAWFSGTGSVFPVYLSVVWGTYHTRSPSLLLQLTFKIWRLIKNLTLTTLHTKFSKWLLLHFCLFYKRLKTHNFETAIIFFFSFFFSEYRKTLRNLNDFYYRLTEKSQGVPSVMRLQCNHGNEIDIYTTIRKHGHSHHNNLCYD